MAFSNDIKRRISLDNLHMQERAVSAELEMRRSHLADLADVMRTPYAGHPITADDLRAIGTDAFLAGGEAVTPHREVRDETRDGIVAVLAALTSYDRAVMAELFMRRFAADGFPLTRDVFFASHKTSHRIAYVRNAYTDEAYDAFSEMLTSSTALFTDSYEEACGEVAEGSAGYCILPWRDTSGLYHRATLGSLENHRLMVVATVSVTDGEDVPMQYALVGHMPLAVEDTWEMQVFLPPESVAELADVLAMTAHFGFSMIGVHMPTDGRGTLCTLRGRTDSTPLLVWLCLFAPTCQIRGFYSYTEGEIK